MTCNLIDATVTMATQVLTLYFHIQSYLELHADLTNKDLQPTLMAEPIFALPGEKPPAPGKTPCCSYLRDTDTQTTGSVSSGTDGISWRVFIGRSLNKASMTAGISSNWASCVRRLCKETEAMPRD